MAGGGMVEVVQEIIARSRRAAVLEMIHNGGLHLAAMDAPEDADLANGALIDGVFVEFTLFDDSETGFDGDTEGFA